MKPLPAAPELLNVARRVVWFKEPEDAFADPVHFLVHVMTYGTIEDLKALRGIVGKEEFCEVLDNASHGRFRRAFVGLLESEVRPTARARFPTVTVTDGLGNDKLTLARQSDGFHRSAPW